MSTISKRGRRPDHVATGHGARRRRGGTPEAGRLFDQASVSTGAGARRARSGERDSSEERQRRLEEVVLTTWAALLAGHPVECPVCGGPLTAARGCSGCGSRLS